MAGCCDNPNFDGMSDRYKTRLWIVIAINAIMFFVEMYAGHAAKSQALQADALDFFGDAVTYGLSMAVIGASLKARASAALFKGVSLALMGIWILSSTIWHTFYMGIPIAQTMGIIGFLALAANLTSVILLVAYKDGDANVRSVWLCSRNDAIGNVFVMLAALGVWGTATGWPDILVAGVMATLFMWSATQILQQGWAEYKQGDEGQKTCDAKTCDNDHTQ